MPQFITLEDCLVKAETEKAILITKHSEHSWRMVDVWVPRSQCAICEPTNDFVPAFEAQLKWHNVNIDMPVWLHRKLASFDKNAKY